MSTFRNAIRPTAEYLRSLPTLETMTTDHGVSPEVTQDARELGVEFQLDLKLVTEDFQYWLCTKGAEANREGVPEAWVSGYITMVPLHRGTGKDQNSYGPGSTRKLQGLDYLNLLGDRMEQLKKKYARSPSDKGKKEIQATHEEIQRVMKSLGFNLPPHSESC